jgi:hypothetical protein
MKSGHGRSPLRRQERMLAPAVTTRNDFIENTVLERQGVQQLGTARVSGPMRMHSRT